MSRFYHSIVIDMQLFKLEKLFMLNLLESTFRIHETLFKMLLGIPSITFGSFESNKKNKRGIREISFVNPPFTSLLYLKKKEPEESINTQSHNITWPNILISQLKSKTTSN